LVGFEERFPRFLANKTIQ